LALSTFPVTEQDIAAGGAAPPAMIPFTVDGQNETFWCWAAVATSVSHFLDHQSIWSQCSLASTILPSQPQCCCGDGSNDCANAKSSNCNRWWYLDNALSETGNLKNWITNIVPATDISNEITAKMPVCLRIEWPDTSGHFIGVNSVSTGSDGNDYLGTTDPIYGLGSFSTQQLIFGQYQQGQGKWTDTYYTQNKQ
jgi:hypothetical protein